MHPILFRIPLPHTPLRLWWALVLLAASAAVFAVLARRRANQAASLGGGVAALVLALCAYLFRDVAYEAGSLPIFSFGVMLGASLVIGWFWSLRRAEPAGLSRETVANAFLAAALGALIGARLIYVLTNLDEFPSFASVFALRRGGYTLYGGLLGGLTAVWIALARDRAALAKYGDVIAPPLALGLALTRVGCWLFGCDFGARLGPGAPAWLAKLGRFPHWAGATQDAGEGAGAYLRQRDTLRGTPEGIELMTHDVSYPVHPTQIYEVLLGVALLGLALWMQRRASSSEKRAFAPGQTFAVVVFGYGVVRFLIEFVRDDPDHRGLGPALPLHWMASLGLIAFALASLWMSASLKDPKPRLGVRIAAFIPALIAFLWLKPASFALPVDVAYSASQWLALLTATAAAYTFNQANPTTTPPARPKPKSPPTAAESA